MNGQLLNAKFSVDVILGTLHKREARIEFVYFYRSCKLHFAGPRFLRQPRLMKAQLSARLYNSPEPSIVMFFLEESHYQLTKRGRSKDGYG